MSQANIWVRVPSTSANLGPGFDVLGLALDLFLEVSARPSAHWLVEIEGHGVDQLPQDETNLVLAIYRRALETRGQPIQPLHLFMKVPTPISRGLGSSAAAIVAGLALADLVWGQWPDKEALFQAAAAEEGHPDNVAPAIFGGLCRCETRADGFSCKVLPIADHVRVLLAIPPEKASTEAMRRALPAQWPEEDLAHNRLMTERLVQALAKGEGADLRCSEEDRMHQPYRLAIQPQAQLLYRLFQRHPQCAGAFLSGSGSTVGGWAIGEDPRAYLQEQLAALPFETIIHLANVDRAGLSCSSPFMMPHP